MRSALELPETHADRTLQMCSQRCSKPAASCSQSALHTVRKPAPPRSFPSSQHATAEFCAPRSIDSASVADWSSDLCQAHTRGLVRTDAVAQACLEEARCATVQLTPLENTYLYICCSLHECGVHSCEATCPDPVSPSACCAGGPHQMVSSAAPALLLLASCGWLRAQARLLGPAKALQSASREEAGACSASPGAPHNTARNADVEQCMCSNDVRCLCVPPTPAKCCIAVRIMGSPVAPLPFRSVAPLHPRDSPHARAVLRSVTLQMPVCRL